jgi:[NiFe] hydrogenase assembly HybE family chaperone
MNLPADSPLRRPAPGAESPAGAECAALAARVPARVQALVAVHQAIARTRMQGLPLLHPALQVAAVGFECQPGAPGWALGVLVTPWFMNLVRLPLQAEAALPASAAAVPGWLAVGHTAARDLGGHRFDFIGSFEEGLGAFEAASLFSPMFQFADQAAAVATAQAVLQVLREPPVPPAPAPAEAPAAAATAAAAQASPQAPAQGLPAPARRGFLFGRSAGAGA